VAKAAERLTVLYDVDCGFCRWALGWILRWDRRRRLAVEPIQGSVGSGMLAELSAEQRLGSWHIVDGLGKRASGGAAFAPLLAVLPGGAPLARLAHSAPAVVNAGYRFVSRRRRFWARLLSRRAIERADRIIESRRK
jgi:predicted DCC family thiol-disulfide oxidoreductase YuxK